MMTLAEFRQFRDAYALQSMTERLDVLTPERNRLRAMWQAKANALWIARYTKNRNLIDRLEYELYDKNDGVTWAWARVDAEIEDIKRDMPVREARLKTLAPLHESMLAAMGFTLVKNP